jgi:XTP/dITP diphosphohydrolase
LIRLDVITTNPGKMREFRAALEPLGFELDQRSEEIEEIQAETLEEVVRNCMAQLKARGLNNYIIDDSGLFIDSLHGFPGVYSAYALNTIGCQGMLQLLRGKDYRTARFRCCIGCSVDDLGEMVVSAEAVGRIIEEERGSGGFGFDPIFVPSGYERTFSELPLDVKNGVSHRGKAINSLRERLLKRMEE